MRWRFRYLPNNVFYDAVIVWLVLLEKAEHQKGRNISGFNMKHLTSKQITLIVFLLPTLVFGQVKYKFKYREYLTSQQSTFTTQLTDTLLEAHKCNLTFFVLDTKAESIQFANVKIKSSAIDTIIRSDIDGFVTVTLPPGVFSISVSGFQSSTLQLDSLETKENTKTTIKTSLGHSNALAIALIYSMRKLTDKEIKKIVDDLSEGKDDNELIKNKTCYVMWEI